MLFYAVMLEGAPKRRFIRAQFITVAVGFALAWSVCGQFARAMADSNLSASHASHPNAASKAPTAQTPPPPNSSLAAATQAGPNCAVVACIALTFDDGPNPIATPIVLQALEQAHVHATFFVVGSRAVTMPNLLQRMHQDGDEIGNHSWGHPDMTKLTAQQIHAQISQTQAAVTAAGVPAPTLFRPPYGFINDTMRAQIHMPFIMWNDDPTDWQTQTTDQTIAVAESEAKPGAIIDMHDIYTSTGATLPKLITDLQQHYQLITVSQLLDLHPGQTGEFFARPAGV